MEEIGNFVTQDGYYNILKDFIFEIYYVVLCCIRTFLEVYTVAVDLRILISWFLNINPYCQPFLTLWEITNPIIYWGRNIYPRIFGIEIAFMINLQILNCLCQAVQNLVLNLEPVHQEIITKIFRREII